MSRGGSAQPFEPHLGDFHDRLLMIGILPPALVREELLR
jgi:hypothetical protein